MSEQSVTQAVAHAELPIFGFEGKTAPDGTLLRDLPDLRDQAPSDLLRYVSPEQHVIHVAEVAPTAISPKLSSSQALCQLMGARSLQEIGVYGPADAALTSAEHSNEIQLNLLGALFGRDSLHMGNELYDDFPALLTTTVVRLAELQGTTFNNANDETPGAIIHWGCAPDDPIAKHITEVNGWEWPHYGSVDATPQFIRSVLRVAADNPKFLDTTYKARNGERHTIRESLEAAIEWLHTRINSNRDGLLEFQTHQARGIWNQAWKDTPESYVHADGSYANHDYGIASIEVQALAYDTLQDIAAFYRSTMPADQTSHAWIRQDLRADLFEAYASNLKEVVLQDFWIEDEKGGYFALATDRDEHGRLRPLAVRTSNMGHALHLLEGTDSELQRRREALVRTLFSDNLLDRNGIRTLASDEKRFVPYSYHCGSVWPWDTRAVAVELERAGLHGLANDLDRRVYNGVHLAGNFVEFLPGNNATSRDAATITHVVDVYDGERAHYSDSYRIMKPSQEIQGWTVAALRKILKKHNPLQPEHTTPARAVDPNLRILENAILGELNLA